MTDEATLREIVPKVFELYGRAAWGMQAAELTMRVALMEVMIELEQTPTENPHKLSFGQLVDRMERLIGVRHADELADLRGYVENRNYLAHHFFIDFVKLARQETSLSDAAFYLEKFDQETAIAVHRVASISEASKLPIHGAFSERHDLRLMRIGDIDPSTRIVRRKFGDA